MKIVTEDNSNEIFHSAEEFLMNPQCKKHDSWRLNPPRIDLFWHPVTAVQIG